MRMNSHSPNSGNPSFNKKQTSQNKKNDDSKKFAPAKADVQRTPMNKGKGTLPLPNKNEKIVHAAVEKKVAGKSSPPLSVSQAKTHALNDQKTNKFNPVGEAGLNGILEKTKTLDFSGSFENPQKAVVQNKNSAPLSGFSNAEDIDIIRKLEKQDFVNEKDLEKLLEINRKKAKQNFSLDKDSIPDANNNIFHKEPVSLRQISIKNKYSAINYAKNQQKKLYLKTVIMSTIALILIVLSFIYATPGSSGTMSLYIALSFIGLIAAIGCGYSELISGVRAVLANRANIDTGIVLMWIFALFQNILAFDNIQAVGDSVQLFSSAAVALSLPVFLAKSINATKTLCAVNAVSGNDILFHGEILREDATSKEMQRNLLKGSKNIGYISKSSSFKDFLAISLNQDISYKICSFIIPLCFLFSVGLGVYIGNKMMDLMLGVSAAVGTFCCMLPVTMTLSLVIPLLNANMSLKKNKACILTYSGASALAKTNAVLLDSSSLFAKDGCTVQGIKPFNSVRLDLSIMYAAALTKKSRSALSGLFKEMVSKYENLLEEPENVFFEEKMGISGVLGGKLVLLGTLDLLEHHNVSLPAPGVFSSYLQHGQKPLFLAIDNTLAAMIIVGYECTGETAKQLQAVTQNAVSLLISSYDPNVNEEFIEKSFSLHKNSVKVISKKYSEYYQTINDKSSETAAVQNSNDGSALSFLQTISASLSLSTIKDFIFVSTFISTLISIAIVCLNTFYEGMNILNSFNIIIYQMFWCLINIIVSIFVGLTGAKK